MTDAQRTRLLAACDFVAASLRANMAPADIIARLQSGYGATVDLRRDPNKLRCAGVTASCTWSADSGLLHNWRKTATTRLMATA